MNIAREVSKRSTCDIRSVGTVIAIDGMIISTGYNGSLRGCSHCDEAGHDLDETGHCVRTVHAEVNAVAQAARRGVSLENSVAYVTALPCFSCFKTLCSSGVKRIYYLGSREDERVRSYSKEAEVEIIKIEDSQ